MKVKNLIVLTLVCLPMIVGAQSLRTINGENNNLQNAFWGASGGEVINRFEPAFSDGISTPARSDQMNPRSISNVLFEQESAINDLSSLSDFIWVFGQFIDHDITLVPNHGNELWQTESSNIVIPAGDEYMDEGKIIPLMRSKEVKGTGINVGNPRRYSNDVTAFIDASAVYGSDIERAEWLRLFSGGKMKMSRGNLLPWNTVTGEFNDQIDADAPSMADDVGTNRKLYVGGDIRANENPLLLSMHTIFVREHNRLCEAWLSDDKTLDADDPITDEILHQRARKLVGAMLQKITYDEWLPSMGIELNEYSGYDALVNPSISNTFSAAAYRWGHTMINDEIARVNLDGTTDQHGNILLQDAFFNPVDFMRMELDPYLKGMGMQMQQNLDCKVVGSLRNFLFKDNPVLGGLDLAAINIERGRERGIKSFIELRTDLGLIPMTSFDQVCADPEVSSLLEQIYGNIENIDPWVGMLAEDHGEGMMFGSMIAAIMREQFNALRDGDRFYYLNDSDLSEEEMEMISSTTLGLLITRNSNIECLQNNVFETTNHNDIPCFPEILPAHLDVAVGPNPIADNGTRLSVYSVFEGPCLVWVIDNMGRQVYSQVVDMHRGENHIEINLGRFVPPGYYHLSIDIDEEIVTRKLLKI